MSTKIAREVAEQEFSMFCEAFDIEEPAKAPTESGPDSEDSDSKNRENIIKAIMSGNLVFDENYEPEYTPVRTKDVGPIHFYEPTGATLLAMDRKKGETAKMMCAMEAMTKSNPGTFSKLKNRDLSVCLSIAVFLLAL